MLAIDGRWNKWEVIQGVWVFTTIVVLKSFHDVIASSSSVIDR